MIVVIVLFTVAVALAAIGVGMLFTKYHHHKEATLEDKMHNLLNIALAKITAAGVAVGHQAQAGGAKIAEVSVSAKDAVASGAASALHASEDEVAYLLRAAADKIEHK
jgi:hypothetical protein